MAVKFDYNQTMNQAKELENIAANLQNRTVNTMDHVYESIYAAWTGDSAKIFLRFLENYQTDMVKKADYIRKTAEFLKNAAKQMQQAEAQARSSASKI